MLLSRMVSGFLKFFFHHFYRSLAWSYDLVAWIVSVGQWRDWIQSCLPFIEGPSVLELGHGPGHLQLEMMKKGWCVFGIDESRQMSRKAQKRLASFLKTKGQSMQGIHLCRGSAMALPYLDECFTTVVATFPTQYIFQPETLAEVSRVLQPGGQLLIILTAWIQGGSIFHRFFGWLFRFTGESLEWQETLSKPFGQANLSLSTQWLSVRSSKVLLIRAAKIS